MREILNLVRKELIQLRRDPVRLRMMLVVPVIQLVLLGYAANLDVREVPMVVLDEDHSAASRDLVARMVGSNYFVLRGYATHASDVTEALDEGTAAIALIIPRGFAADLAAHRTAALQSITDGSDAAFAARSIGYAAMVVRQFSSNVAIERADRAGRATPELSVRAATRVWFNPELDSRWFLVPGILALVLMVIAMIGTAMGLVREREIGTLEQLVVTPIRPFQLIIGKLIPNALVGIVEVVLVLLVMTLVFGVPIRGSVTLLMVLTMIFLFAMQGLGLLISTMSRTQQQAMMSAMFFVLLPMLLLSGFIFPIENMPKAIQVVTYAIPLRYYFEIIRGIVLKGVGLGLLWDETLALIATGVVGLYLAVVRMRKSDLG